MSYIDYISLFKTAINNKFFNIGKNNDTLIIKNYDRLIKPIIIMKKRDIVLKNDNEEYYLIPVNKAIDIQKNIFTFYTKSMALLQDGIYNDKQIVISINDENCCIIDKKTGKGIQYNMEVLSPNRKIHMLPSLSYEDRTFLSSYGKILYRTFGTNKSYYFVGVLPESYKGSSFLEYHTEDDFEKNYIECDMDCEYDDIPI